MNNDSRMLIYVCVMTLLFSCVGLGYSLVFFGWGPGKSLSTGPISPSLIAIALISGAVNAIATNIISDRIKTKLETLHPILIKILPWIVFFATLAISILIALISIV